MSFFETHGRALLAGGYLIIPIQPGKKSPGLAQWQRARLGAGDLSRYPAHGVGVLCGQGAHPLSAVDVDTSHPELAERFVRWCQERLGVTVERVGNAPKVMLVYRAAEEGFSKSAGAWFEDADGGRHRLEVLGHGQQFVAYHIHPETNRPYEWTDLLGGLDAVPAASLPCVTESQLQEAVAAFAELAIELGLTQVQGTAASAPRGSVDDDPLMTYSPPVGLTLEEAAHLLSGVNREDYDAWLKAGMALHHEFGASPAALDTWDAWSCEASNYAGRADLEHRWMGFGQGAGRQPVTARWLLKTAKAAGVGNGRLQLTEFGLAERMIEAYGAGLMYVPELDEWRKWSGVYWQRVPPVELEHLAKQTVRALVAEANHAQAPEERAALVKFSHASQRASIVAHTVSLARSDPRVVVSVDELDPLGYLMGARNGVIDLRTGALLPADPAHRITSVVGCGYDPSAVCQLWEATVSDIFCGDMEMVEFVQRLIGYSLLGRPIEDIMPIFYGAGSNGKSTLLGAVQAALGGYARTSSAETFMSSGPSAGRAGAAREDVLRLRGARFVYIDEPDDGAELREALIKSITGGEMMAARALYARQTVEYRPAFVLFCGTNYRPIIKGDDHGIWRRIVLLPFTRNFDADPTARKDGKRKDRLREADMLPGVLAWCVRGALAYQQRGLDMPPAVQAARAQYRRDMDLLAEWLEECCELGDEYFASSQELWISWEAWARARGTLKLCSSTVSLGKRLASRFRAVPGRAGRGWTGVKVRAVGDFV